MDTALLYEVAVDVHGMWVASLMAGKAVGSGRALQSRKETEPTDHLQQMTIRMERLRVFTK
jgi:hypothetical protein